MADRDGARISSDCLRIIYLNRGKFDDYARRKYSDRSDVANALRWAARAVEKNFSPMPPEETPSVEP